MTDEPYKMLEIASRIAGISSTERAIRLMWLLSQAILEKGGDLTVTDAAFTNAVVDVLPVSQVRQDQSIFSRYTLKETVLLYPWDYFAIDLRCALYVGRECFDAVTAGVEIIC